MMRVMYSVEDVVLMYGTFGDNLAEVVMPFSQTQDGYIDTHTPKSAAIYATDDRVMVAISGDMSWGSSGVVGWVFYEFPP